MTAFYIFLSCLCELAAIALLIYGYMHEDKVITFEQNVKRIVVGNYRRYKRMRGNKRWM